MMVLIKGSQWQVAGRSTYHQYGLGDVVVGYFRSFRVLKAIVIGLSDLGCAFDGIFKRPSHVLSGFHKSVYAKLAQQRSNVADDRTDRRLGNM